MTISPRAVLPTKVLDAVSHLAFSAELEHERDANYFDVGTTSSTSTPLNISSLVATQSMMRQKFRRATLKLSKPSPMLARRSSAP
jgi:hypothetical protein